jgi:hypothetical protein
LALHATTKGGKAVSVAGAANAATRGRIAFAFVATMLLLVGSFSLLMHEIFIASHSLPATALHRRQPEGQN